MRQIFAAINVCGTEKDDCPPGSMCISTGPGTKLCSCNAGFTGDGKSCESESYF